MLGFQPLAAAPLGDIAEGGLAFSDITSGAPVVDNAVLTQNHVIVAQEITGQASTLETITLAITQNLQAGDITIIPVVDSISVIQQQLLSPSEITAGIPVVESADLTFFFDFNADEITAGAPLVDGIDYTEFTNFNADSISVTPVVDNADILFTHIMGAGDITSGAPEIAVRFLWDYQEPFSDTWTEVSDITDIWTDVSDTTKTWTEAA